MPRGVFVRTEEYREKIRQASLRNGNKPPSPLGTVWTDERKEKLAAKKRGIPRPEHVKAKMARGYFKAGHANYADRREPLTAEKNPFWKGGTSRAFMLKSATRPKPANCEVCDAPAINFKKGLCFDHDHVTGAFRGWLCTRCNVAIGMVNDDTDLMRALIGYLDKHKGA